MSSMRIYFGNGEPWVFDVNPSDASWGYTMNIKQFDTYGGRVVQLLSCRIDDLTISGNLSSKGAQSQWEPMLNFEGKIKSILAAQSKTGNPVTVQFDEVDWSGEVFLIGYSDVSYNIATTAVSYTLNFTVDSGFERVVEGITEDAKSSIGNVAAGVNWIRSKYNTPAADDWEQVKEALGQVVENTDSYNSDSKGIYDYLGESEDDDSSETVDNADSDSDFESNNDKPSTSIDKSNFGDAYKESNETLKTNINNFWKKLTGKGFYGK